MSESCLFRIFDLPKPQTYQSIDYNDATRVFKDLEAHERQQQTQRLNPRASYKQEVLNQQSENPLEEPTVASSLGYHHAKLIIFGAAVIIITVLILIWIARQLWNNRTRAKTTIQTKPAPFIPRAPGCATCGNNNNNPVANPIPDVKLQGLIGTAETKAQVQEEFVDKYDKHGHKIKLHGKSKQEYKAKLKTRHEHGHQLHGRKPNRSNAPDPPVGTTTPSPFEIVSNPALPGPTTTAPASTVGQGNLQTLHISSVQDLNPPAGGSDVNPTDPGAVLSNLIDGNPNTYWNPAPSMTDYRLQFNLAQPAQIRQMTVIASGDNIHDPAGIELYRTNNFSAAPMIRIGLTPGTHAPQTTDLSQLNLITSQVFMRILPPTVTGNRPKQQPILDEVSFSGVPTGTTQRKLRLLSKHHTKEKEKHRKIAQDKHKHHK